MLELIADKKVELTEEEVKNFNPKGKNSNFHDCASIILLAKQRLQFVLRTLIKLSLNKAAATKDCSKLVDVYKDCYSLTFSLEKCTEFYSFVNELNSVLLDVRKKIDALD